MSTNDPVDSDLPHGSGAFSEMLAAAGAGDRDAAARIADHVYGELRAIASRLLNRERQGQTLRTTALVNEAYVKIVGGRSMSWEGRAHFLGVAARAMRSVLVDYARARRARKRGGAWKRVALDEVLQSIEVDRVDLLALDDALGGLQEIAPRKAQVVELRFFGGLSIADTARILEVSHTTVENDWQFARTWIHRELAGGSES